MIPSQRLICILSFSFSQKHSLLEADITVVGERVMTTKASALHYAEAENEDIGGYKPCDPNIIKDRCAHLDAAYEGKINELRLFSEILCVFHLPHADSAK